MIFQMVAKSVYRRTGLILGSTVSTGWSVLSGFEILSVEGEGVTLREIEVVGLGRFSLPRQLTDLSYADGSSSFFKPVFCSHFSTHFKCK
jgi:hypothetical protein